MKFILNLARRELRASWRRLLFFFLCIGVGVGSIVALRSMIQSLNRAVAGEARALMTADVQTETTREWSADALARIERVARPPLAEARTETIEAPTMLRPADSSREGALMVEVKGVERGFPLYGEFLLADGKPFDYALVEGGGAVVAPLLLERLTLRVGDHVKIGEREFEIRGVTKQEPGSSGGFRLGPRVFLARADLEAAGLTGFGSRARRKLLFRAGEGAYGRTRPRAARRAEEHPRQRALVPRLGGEFERAVLARGELPLADGLVVLVLGGIGVSTVTRVFVEQKRRTIAVLKCVGATGRMLTAAYLAQVLALGASGESARRAAGEGGAPLRPRAFRGEPAAATSLTTLTGGRGRCRGWRSACSSRCSSRRCRSCAYAASSRTCSCATRRSRSAPPLARPLARGRGGRRARRARLPRLVAGGQLRIGVVFLSGWA